MARKGDSQPEQLAHDVITALERGVVAPTLSLRSALFALLLNGPYWVPAAAADGFDSDPWDASVTAGELLAYVRSIVRQGRVNPTLSTAPIRIGAIQVSAFAAPDGRVVAYAEGALRDLLVLQFVTLLNTVGLRQVRECGAEDCAHLFIKSYRREFCSQRCQKRTFKRAEREAARAHEERERRRRQRARA